ncbi:glycerophosphodiester phosphodiesterase protein kinase domain-containing GDPDL2-like [Gossypium australe]|uniref:Glycerophosphodiester phosphodiesterase protein kinase domain-containing GDPDL2-like n=1 Tax=Gossypium australe TaxID=47621 RepID=A0A5B6U9G1_9ROSI|nr:glycerophosphodiester phosphodiesterase protein kinase domain-containing GDPDL2-like [Gossypium australe]
MVIILCHFFLIYSAAAVGLAPPSTYLDGCQPMSCKRGAPSVRFPFQLKGRQHESCGSPGFNLSCNNKNQTVLELPKSVKLLVKRIDYVKQMIQVYAEDRCVQKQLPNLTLSSSPFKFMSDYYSFDSTYENFTLFKCAGEGRSHYDSYNTIGCLSREPGSYVKYTSSDYPSTDLLHCRRTMDLREVPEGLILDKSNNLYFHWSSPECGSCEEHHQGCRRNNTNHSGFECFPIPTKHMALKPSRYSYAHIKRITFDFKEKLGQGGYGTVFKGTLSNDVSVTVKLLNNFKGNGEEFINEVSSMGRIHHVNVTRLVGFCAHGYNRASVYGYLTNESLEKFIFGDKGCEQRILHFDIKPHNILLDQHFNPKISDFGLAKLCSKEQSAVSMTATRGTMGYIVPEVLSRNFGNVSYKSDVYSFGMMLLEMVGGRKNIDVKVEHMSQVYFPEWSSSAGWLGPNIKSKDDLFRRLVQPPNIPSIPQITQRKEMVIILFHFFLLYTAAAVGLASPPTYPNGCQPTRCKRGAPSVRFPFQLKGRQHENCGSPGFNLSCDNKNQTVLELPKSVKLLVKRIDYVKQMIQVYAEDGCVQNQLPNLTMSLSPFNLSSGDYYYSELGNYTLFECSDEDSNDNSIRCLSSKPGFYVKYTDSDYASTDLLHCRKTIDLKKFPIGCYHQIGLGATIFTLIGADRRAVTAKHATKDVDAMIPIPPASNALSFLSNI